MERQRDDRKASLVKKKSIVHAETITLKKLHLPKNIVQKILYINVHVFLMLGLT